MRSPAKKGTFLKRYDKPTQCRRCRADGDDTWHRWGWNVSVRRRSTHVCNAHLETHLKDLVR